ncbi:energy transducer TonB [Aminobacter sp. Piv2-1]|uniref:energy transducer TonB n=1 Tax=Aminobacter sp. Piv2-1 TaxID=3031122 RepID=UPI0030A5F8C8
MGLEPAFAKSTVAWPLAGIGAWPIEPDDPAFAIPQGALRICARDTAHRTYLADASPLLTVPASEPLAPNSAPAKARSRKWLTAVLASVALHSAVAMFVMTRDDSDQILIEGSANTGITLFGNAAEDQSTAGDPSEIDSRTVTNVTMVTMLDARPVETTEAQAVPDLSPVEPVETAAQETPDEIIEPVTDQPLQPATTDPLPEILATDRIEPVEDDNIIQKPAEMARVEPVEIEAAATPAPVPEKIVAETEPEPVKPEAKPEPVKKAAPKPARKPETKAEQPKKLAKAPARKEKPGKAGSAGNGQVDARKGDADGAANGTKATTGRNGGSASAGNALVSNYPGKVAAKLRRALRGISRAARAKARSDVQVSFTVGASGGVDGIRIVQSSGSAELDAAALEVVRRAAPFPPIPAEAGRPSWQFTLPLGIGR